MFQKFQLFALAALTVFAVALFLDPALAHATLAYLTDNPHGAAMAVVAAALPEAISTELSRISGEIKGYAEKAEKEIKAHAKLTDETKASVDDLLQKQAEISGRLQTAEQIVAKLEQGRQGGDIQPKSLGEQFVESDGLKAFAAQASRRGRFDMSFNAAITTVTTDTDGAAGDMIQRTRVPGVNTIPERRMTIRDLITPGRTGTGLVEYVKETGFTNNAAETAEGAAKPQSTLKYDLITTTAKVIAHYVKASRQILSDAPQLQSLINNRLLYGLAYREEAQLLNGDGTGSNLLGIIPQATAYAAPFDPAGTETNIDNIRLAMLQAALAEYPASGIVMHPSDWARIELLKDSTGRYIIGNPQDGTTPTLWGLPVVATQAITVDKFLVGAFRLGAQVFDAWQARVEVATENEDDFIKNMVTILAEERLALAVYRPEAFVYGDFGNVA
jgi:HK97 family phage major capsid protein